MPCTTERPPGIGAGGEDVDAATRGPRAQRLATVTCLRRAAGFVERARPAAGDGERLVVAGKEELALQLERDGGRAAAGRQVFAAARAGHVEAQQQHTLVLVQQCPRLRRRGRVRRARAAGSPA